MSVLIKGFEKPDHCLRCPMKGIDDECVLQGVEVCDEYEDWKQQMANCPLVPVPPHGRLIDADAYEELIRGLGNREYRRENGTICDAIKFLHPHYAPTIIPAEEAKDTNVPTYDLLYEEGGYNSNGV